MRRGLGAALCALGLWLGASAGAKAQENEDVDWDAVFLMAPKQPPAAPVEEDEAAVSAKPARRGKKKPAARKKPRAEDRAYTELTSTWHQPIEDGSWGNDANGLPPLVLRGLGPGEPIILTPEGERGGFDEGDLSFASQLMGSWDGGPRTHPRLLDLIYRAVRHFGVKYVTVVSGIRRDRKGSRHSHGLAADIVLPGVNDEQLAAFFRAQGFVGVGTYPRAGFVHVDVRERSYFWVDKSAPGRRSRQVQVRADEAKATDDAALARGELPLINPDGLQKALRTRAHRRAERHAKKREREEAQPEKRRRSKERGTAAAPRASSAPTAPAASTPP